MTLEAGWRRPDAQSVGGKGPRHDGAEVPLRLSILAPVMERGRNLYAGLMILLAVAGCACGPSRGAADAGQGRAAPAAGTEAALARGQVRAPSGKSFEVEIVQDPPGRQRGLQHRARLDPGEGMLFIFPRPAKERFWMYECLIPLDILWLDASGRVIHIENNLPICSTLPCPDYGPDQEAHYVLELGAGVAARSGIAVGQRLELLFADPPRPS